MSQSDFIQGLGELVTTETDRVTIQQEVEDLLESLIHSWVEVTVNQIKSNITKRVKTGDFEVILGKKRIADVAVAPWRSGVEKDELYQKIKERNCWHLLTSHGIENEENAFSIFCKCCWISKPQKSFSLLQTLFEDKRTWKGRVKLHPTTKAFCLRLKQKLKEDGIEITGWSLGMGIYPRRRTFDFGDPQNSFEISLLSGKKIRNFDDELNYLSLDLSVKYSIEF